jgi:adenosylhomocysteine nucleosidase
MGKVNAAMAATLLVEQFQPTHVLFTGIAGGLNPDLRPGDVVIGAKTAYSDRYLPPFHVHGGHNH